ncbi:hypothetical protein EW145_g2013 [Phellinidium pouzarii]|uniref:F-box domain-containing protein n=1 Tax=Phellinidium pouzarii TaxID=167371 RepID=A0A4V6S198_9AGAM|nr:hypothetical protein EW145_g2013 [Phellinidium pouzarii]
MTHVSRVWRCVAVSIPRLWTRLSVVVQRADINSALELIKLWVPRCRSRPLKIDLTIKKKSCPVVELICPEDFLALFRVLTKTAALLRKGVTNDLDRAYFETHLTAGNSGMLPIVEERYFWFYGRDGAPRTNDELLAPLTVSGIRLASEEFNLEYHSPLSASLTQLNLKDTDGISCLSTTDIVAIFSECKQLRRASVYIDYGDTPLPGQVVAENLISLRLSWAYTADCGALFDHIIAPKLEELEISGDVPAGGPWDHFWRFIVQSRPPLKTLVLEQFDATDDVTNLAECLTIMDQLDSLWLENCVVDDAFIASLGRRSSSGDSVFSRLRAFGLVSADDINGNCLVQSFRNSDRGQLKELFVFDCNGVLQKHCDEIEEYFGTTQMESIIVTPGDEFE